MPPRKPAKPAALPTGAEEARRAGALLEEVRSSLRIVAEGVADLQKRMMRLETSDRRTAEDIDLIKSVSRRNADEIDRITRELSTLNAFAVDHSKKFDAIDAQLKLLRDDVKGFTGRVEALEAQLPS